MPSYVSGRPMEDDGLRSVFQKYPGRQRQIRTLATLVDPMLAPCRNIVVHGTEATGKSTVTAAVLEALRVSAGSVGISDASGDGTIGESMLDYAIVNSNECVTARHLFERTVTKVAEAVRWSGPKGRRCESLAQLAVELAKMLRRSSHPEEWQFVVVFDAIDRQRDAPSTLLPGLARLSEIIPNLTTIFIVTFPSPSFLRVSAVPHVQFENYTKAEFVELLARTPPDALPNATMAETTELWTRFCGAVHDALIKTAARTLPAFQEACAALWPKFTAPVLAGTHGPREFSKLLIAARVHFQDESLLDPGFTAAPAPAPFSADDDAATKAPSVTRGLAALLPTTARLFLLCAYVASHNAPKHDLTLFSTYYHGRKRRRGGAGMPGARRGARSKHRKIARKLLGAHAFPLERLLAIFAAVRSEWTHAPPAAATGRNSTAAMVDGDASTALATLASLRLVLRVSSANSDPLDRAGKWRGNVGWDMVRSLGRRMGVELEDWLID
ncbi:origin recognition complex subunit [Niveomyces insectorum RCEF 264]|uniref:Origin recognition complex subunit n=1 Tax=Niveomyces insectorum RCEF 264 TaxID=1081102 RepID=A0A167ZBU1_9HYPO|nr:origin recognition complex subunit [Niveomyces insectorum RCEF 264]